MNSSQIYFHNFELIDHKKKSILFIPGAGMDHRFTRALNFSKAEYNPPLVIDLPGHGDSKGTSCNNIKSYVLVYVIYYLFKQLKFVFKRKPLFR